MKKSFLDLQKIECFAICLQRLSLSASWLASSPSPASFYTPAVDPDDYHHSHPAVLKPSLMLQSAGLSFKHLWQQLTQILTFCVFFGWNFFVLLLLLLNSLSMCPTQTTLWHSQLCFQNFWACFARLLILPPTSWTPDPLYFFFVFFFCFFNKYKFIPACFLDPFFLLKVICSKFALPSTFWNWMTTTRGTTVLEGGKKNLGRVC